MFRLLHLGFLVVLLHSFVACDGESPGKMYGFSVSPDGKFLGVSFVKGKTFLIYRIALDTGRAIRFTDAASGEESGPAFSPDGRLVAYSYVPEGDTQRIIVMNVDGSNPRSLPASGTANLDAVFASTGQTIYFPRSLSPPHYHEWDLFSVRIDGSQVQQLTHEGFYHVSQPSVSPDGKSVVLVTEGLNMPQQISIYLPDHPEKQPLSLRPHVPREARGGAIFDNAQYLPDGKSILCMAASEGKSGFDYDIYRLELASSTLERLTYGNGFASDLCVFPDGRRAIFQKWHSDWRGTSNAAELYIIDLQSHKLMRFKVTGLN